MGKFLDYLQENYHTNYASFIPNYYTLIYKTNNSKVKFCMSCRESIEDNDRYVWMWNKTHPVPLYMCVECGKECAELHKMEIGDY